MSCGGNSCGGKNCSNDAKEAFKASENDVVQITTIPTLPTRKCRLIATMLGLALSFGNYVIALIVYLFTQDVFISGGILLLGYIVSSIIVSKLITMSVPLSNREFSYSDEEVATWYLSAYYC